MSQAMNEQDYISRITELLTRCTNVQHGQGASSREILEAELLLGVAFPQDFRAYLTHFGWLSFSAEELFGLGSDISRHNDVVSNWRCEYEEVDYRDDLPRGLVPLRNNGFGDISFLDTSRCDGKRCPVVTHWHETQEIERIADSFGDWLCEMIRESNRYDAD